MPITEAQKRATYNYRKTENGQAYLEKYKVKLAKKYKEMYANDAEYREAKKLANAQYMYAVNAINFVKYLYGVPYSNRGRPSTLVYS